jgi:DnaJ like chaperone protein
MQRLKYWIGKIVGIAAGTALGGFVGLFLGLIVGAIVDKLHEDGIHLWINSGGPAVEDMDPSDFIVGSILLAAAVVKSDGEVDELELSYVRSFLVEQFGTLQMDDYWHILMHSIENDFDLKKVTQQIRKSTGYETRLQLIHFLFGIANADYNIDDTEVATLKVVSLHLGIHSSEFDSIKAMFYHEMDAYYKILELLPSASDDDVRTAYRVMSKKYHPDKLEHLGSGVKKAATRKYLKVKEAYDNVRKERGFS